MVYTHTFCIVSTSNFKEIAFLIHNIKYGILKNVTGPAKIDHVSAKESPIFSVFAVS